MNPSSNGPPEEESLLVSILKEQDSAVTGLNDLEKRKRGLTSIVFPFRRTLTTGQVAKLCGVAPRTATMWCVKGQLKHYILPLSQDRRIPIDSLLAFLTKHGYSAPASLRGGFILTCGLTGEDMSIVKGHFCGSVCEFGAELEHGLWDYIFLGDSHGLVMLKEMAAYARGRCHRYSKILGVIDSLANPTEVEQSVPQIDIVFQRPMTLEMITSRYKSKFPAPMSTLLSEDI